MNWTERWIGLDAKILRPYKQMIRSIPINNTFQNIRKLNK
jgi:hypothetical protein